MKNLYLASISLFLWMACSQPRSGCLDIEGVNYDVTAELDCCCEFPVLGVNFLPLYDGEPLALGGFSYANARGESYGILSGRMLFRNFLLQTEAGEWIEIRDSVGVPLEGLGQRFLKNDVVYIDRLTPRNFPLRTVPVNNFFAYASTALGMEGDFCRINPFGLPSNSTLGRAMNGLYEPELEEVFSVRLELLTDTLGGIDTRKIVYIPLCNAPFAKKPLGQAGAPGFNFSLPLKIDFKILLDQLVLEELDTIVVLKDMREAMDLSISFQ
jgi:hypothetical protein